MSRSLFAGPELAARHDAAFKRAMERRREAPPRPRRWVRLFLVLVCLVAVFVAWYVA